VGNAVKSTVPLGNIATAVAVVPII